MPSVILELNRGARSVFEVLETLSAVMNPDQSSPQLRFTSLDMDLDAPRLREAEPKRRVDGLVWGDIPGTFLVPAVVTEDGIGRLFEVEEGTLVRSVHDNPAIGPLVAGDPPARAAHTDVRQPIGHVDDVATRLREGLQEFTGTNVRIGIFDTGVDRELLRQARAPRPGDALVGGWAPAGSGFPRGTDISPVPHGTMVAFDALAVAPDADVMDYGVLKPRAGTSADMTPTWDVFNVLEGYEQAIDDLRAGNGPHVACNSWGIVGPLTRGYDWIEYAYNPQHIVTQRIVQAMNLGMLVVFAAGNAGSFPHGQTYLNPSIPHEPMISGAGGHPDVITVGAVGYDDERWLEFSSEGPSALRAFKPDVCAYSQYRGFMKKVVQGTQTRPMGDPDLPDGGTSAAAPLVAGVVAALREQYGDELTQPRAAQSLRSTAFNPARLPAGEAASNVVYPVWDAKYGYGVIRTVLAKQWFENHYT